MTNETVEKGRIEEALGKYNLEISDEEVKEAVKKIIAEKVHENDNLETKKFLIGSVELTTLKTTDSDESVMAFRGCRRPEARSEARAKGSDAPVPPRSAVR